MHISQKLKLVLIVPAFAIGFAGAVVAGDKHAKNDIPVTTDSPEAKALFAKGREALDRGDLPDANALFQQAVKIDPDFTYAWVGVANSGFSFAEFGNASRKALEVSEGKSEGERILAEINLTFVDNDADKRLELAARLTELYPESPRAWISFAGANGGLNKTHEAREALNKAIALDPEFVLAHTNLGFSYLRGEPKDFAKAEQSMQKAIELDPGNDNSWANLGDIFRARKDLAGAREAYSKATEIDGTNAIALVKKGHVGSFLGRYGEARADYDRSVEVSPPPTQPFYANYRAFTHVHEGNPAAAIAELETILKGVDELDISEDQRPGARIFTLSNIATIALHNDMFDVAESAIERLGVNLRDNAKRVGGENVARAQEATIAYWQGQLAARRGDFDLAVKKAEENARLVEPDSNPRKMEAYHDLMGLVNLRQGNHAKAVEHYGKADHRNTMYIRYHQGLALAGAGEADKAARIFKEVGEWNFNSVGFALVRKDALSRASGV